MNRDHYLSKRKTSLPASGQQVASKDKADVVSKQTLPIETEDNLSKNMASGAKPKTKNKN